MKAAIVMHMEGDGAKLQDVLSNFRGQWERRHGENTQQQNVKAAFRDDIPDF